MKLAAVLFSAAALAARMPVYVYSGEWNDNDAPIQNKLLAYASAGASHIVLAFHVYTSDWASSGYKAGSVKAIADLSPTDRKTLIDKLHSVGTEVIISTGGESAGSTWVNITPAEYAANLCGMASELGVDGVDFDLEFLPSRFGDSMSGQYAKWNTDVIAECKKHFNGYITAAPQSPYVMPAWSGNYGYDKYGFDRLLIQYYNQGTWSNEHVKDGLFGSSSGSIKDLMARNPDAPKDAFVVGKPLIPVEDGNDNASFSDEELKAWGCEAWKTLGWRGGFMFWRGHWDNPTAQMKIALFAKPCPGDEGDDDTTTTSTTARPTTRPTTPSRTDAPVRTTTIPRTSAESTRQTTPSKPTNPATTPANNGGDETYDTICPGGAISDPSIAECISRVQTQPYWLSACRANCLTIGPGGCLHETMCPSFDGSAESLLKCVSTNYPYCTY